MFEEGFRDREGSDGKLPGDELAVKREEEIKREGRESESEIEKEERREREKEKKKGEKERK